MASPQICVVGSANVDLTFRTSRLPRPGETLAGHGFHQGFGGKGANQAVAAARLGAAVTFIGRVGNDAFGHESLRRYQVEALNIDHVSIDVNRPTGTAAIIVDDTAENCIVVIPGANAGLSPQDVRDAADGIRQSAVLLAQLEVPIETVVESFRLARAAGVRTVLTPAPAAELPDELYRLCDVCLPNETELRILTDRDDDVEASARQLQSRGPRAVIVTLGERGALLVDGNQAAHVAAIPVHAVDPTGAGDAFSAAVAVAWAEGQSLAEAARWAAFAAALTVTRQGAQGSFPTRAEVEAFRADHVGSDPL